MVKKKITNRNTKAEILQAFEELKSEKSTLESQVKQLQQDIKTVLPQPPKVTEIPPQETTKARKTMNQTQLIQADIAQTLKSLEQLHIGFGSAASQLSEQLSKEASTLEELNTAVNGELEQLATLHNLTEIDDTTLDNSIESYQEISKTFAIEYNEQRETLTQELQDQKAAWQKEQETRDRVLKERNENHRKTRQRDEAEYYYNLELERHLDTENYEQEKQQLYAELAAIQLTQEKAWEEREKSISEREKQYLEAQEKVEEFATKKQENIKNGKETGRNIGHYQAKIKADLYSKEIEGETRNYQLRIESLEQTIQNQDNRILNLAKQLDAALKQVQDLAVKAIEGTSNRNSFDALKEVALEQAKNQNKNK
ncbi:MAG: hypothetical protein SAJ12_06490 [Jaaginema sp. PMC 1079.18]|nr:hypothetical protein [Jaaginema sp. PMC 1080.18]MEC4850641.1 hypothetical protein [Jaaginema sp. PMC 1079.18]MEC4866311.1 hypothetical protein [Jaaginema sp. PMC 1078.18]